MLTGLTWRKAVCEPSGLVDVSRVQPRTMRGYETILARTTIDAAAAGTKKFDIGYSDIVSVFINGTLVYTANSTYQLRDPSFLGVVGPFDALYLPLRKGRNELLLYVTEVMGGWGFLVRDGTASYQDKSMARLWEIDRAFAFPESAAYDPKGQVVFVSSFDAFNRSAGEGRQSIAKLSADGRVLEKDWAKGLFNPTGLVIRGDRLYAVERRGVVEIDMATGKVLKRHQIPEPLMPNDIAIDGSGTIYVSDSAKSVIYRITDGTVEEWLKGDEIRTPNGLCVRDNELIIGNNGDFSLKAAGLADRKVRTVARLSPGIIDGIAVDEGGGFLVSHYDGRLYRIAPDGGITKLLDTSTLGRPIADFGYDAETGRFFIPTFIENGVVAYQLKEH
jgi:sugar lactone lactonase YvrE